MQLVGLKKEFLENKKWKNYKLKSTNKQNSKTNSHLKTFLKTTYACT